MSRTIFAVLMGFVICTAQADNYDVLIRNGTVYDAKENQ